MKNLFLVRHCQAEGQAPHAPLTADGHSQAQELVDFFANEKLDRIVSSPFQRAVDTINPLAEKLGIVTETDDRLIERALSVAPLSDWQERLKQSFEDLDIFYEGGESGREAMTRGITVLRGLLDSDAANAVVVTHGALLTLLLHHFDKDYGYEEWLSLTNPDVYRLEFDESEYPQIDPHIERIWKG